MNFEFNPMNFVENLKYMGVGMLGIFIIVGIIIASTYLIGYFANKIPDDSTEE